VSTQAEGGPGLSGDPPQYRYATDLDGPPNCIICAKPWPTWSLCNECNDYATTLKRKAGLL
jgi:hypothetical protein